LVLTFRRIRCFPFTDILSATTLFSLRATLLFHCNWTDCYAKFENSRGALTRALILLSASGGPSIAPCWARRRQNCSDRDSNGRRRLTLYLHNVTMKEDAAEELRSIILLSVCWAWTFSTVRYKADQIFAVHATYLPVIRDSTTASITLGDSSNIRRSQSSKEPEG
jgi:hypothetical protein